jgi:hypothetical protein
MTKVDVFKWLIILLMKVLNHNNIIILNLVPFIDYVSKEKCAQFRWALSSNSLFQKRNFLKM